MASVTGRISKIKQPYGGYIKPSSLNKTLLNSEDILNEEENIPPSIVGTVVDYMTRFLITGNKERAFSISLEGVWKAYKSHNRSVLSIASNLFEEIKGLEDKSIINACKLVTFDVWYRNPIGAMLAGESCNTINPDQMTINNITILIKRSIKFFDEYGPIICNSFSFKPKGGRSENFKSIAHPKSSTYGGYTSTVDSGDGDFLTKDTLWDFKVSKHNPTSADTLQLLMYWIMGQHSERDEFKGIKKLGIFNPRLNVVYLYDIDNVPKEVIEEIERDVICY